MMKRYGLRLLIFALLFGFVVGVRPLHAANQVVGNGTPANCNAPALEAAVNTVQSSGGGTVTFNCGQPMTISLSSQLYALGNVTIDGGSQITLTGGDTTRHFYVDTNGNLTLKNITLTHGFANGDGGSIVNNGTLTLENVRAISNATTVSGSGGAIVSYGFLTIKNSGFFANKAANGGALYLRFDAITHISNTELSNNGTISTTDGFGGAILLWGQSILNIDKSSFNLNYAQYGGAIYNPFANAVINFTDSTISAAAAKYDGGAIYNAAGGIFNVTRSTIEANDAENNGGAIYNDGLVNLSQTTLKTNRAQSHGGGVYNSGTLNVSRSLLTGNYGAVHGGGVYNLGKAAIRNSTLSGNTAVQRGGGIFNSDGTTVLNYVTLSGNKAGEAGGGGNIYHNTSLDTAAGITYHNTILANPQGGGNCGKNPFGIGDLTSAGYNISSDKTCPLGQTGDRNNTNPKLGPLASNGSPVWSHLPLEGSPAIDKGIAYSTISIDQRGLHRPSGKGFDIGAIEVQQNDLFLPFIIK